MENGCFYMTAFVFNKELPFCSNNVIYQFEIHCISPGIQRVAFSISADWLLKEAFLQLLF